MLKIVKEEIVFESTVRFNILPTEYIQTLDNSPTPSVLNGHYFVANGNTITNFKDGSTGQRITILGDGVAVVSNGTSIVTTSGANVTLLANRLYSFVYFKTNTLDKWIQEG